VEFFFDLHLARDGGYHPYSRLEPRHYGPRGHLCTTGNMVRSLIRFGYLRDERVESAIDWLIERQLPDGGWDCFWRRHGTLDGWEAMSAFAEIPPARRSSEIRRVINTGANFYLKRRLLHEGKTFNPWYLLRYPWHYFYDVLVGLDFMTALGYGKDHRINEALTHLISKRLADGSWKLGRTNGDLRLETPGEASKMITFLSLRVIKRVTTTQRSTP
jgi:hypothetical protein